MAYSPTMMRWVSEDPMGYVDGQDLYQFERSSPVSSLDPLGLATAASQPATGPSTQPVIPAGAQPFLISNDIVISGTLKIRMFTDLDKPPTKNMLGLEPFHLTTTYIIENNYVKKMKTPLSPFGDTSYPLPKGIGAGFGNSIPLSFTAGTAFSVK